MTSSTLHILAMIFMLLDHIWATQANIPMAFTCIGRLAFPIYAFMIVEGFYHTSNLKNYMKRLFCFALISEIPFNLMTGGSIINPFHQNVLWTFLVALWIITLIEKCKKKSKGIYVICVAFLCVVGYMLGLITMVDYHGAGVLTVLVFYLFRNQKVIQTALLYLINSQLIGGLVLIFGNFEIGVQLFALLSLIFIFSYNGKKGYNHPYFKKFCYWFYPVHMLILYLI